MCSFIEKSTLLRKSLVAIHNTNTMYSLANSLSSSYKRAKNALHKIDASFFLFTKTIAVQKHRFKTKKRNNNSKNEQYTKIVNKAKQTNNYRRFCKSNKNDTRFSIESEILSTLPSSSCSVSFFAHFMCF